MNRRTPLCLAVVTGSAILAPGIFQPSVVHAAPPRPDGLAQINAAFGSITYVTNWSSCVAQNPLIDDASVFWKHGGWTGNNTNVTRQGHGYLANEFALAKAAIVQSASNENITYYGIGHLDCRAKKTNPSQISVHSWGITTDTNTALNPLGASSWNGTGANGVNYGNTLPDIWKSNSGGFYVNFVWGLSWNDPHHFQYATGY